MISPRAYPDFPRPRRRFLELLERDLRFTACTGLECLSRPGSELQLGRQPVLRLVGRSGGALADPPKLLAATRVIVRWPGGDVAPEVELHWKFEAIKLRSPRRAELVAELSGRCALDERRGVDPESRGWVEKSRLCKALGISRANLNVTLYRLRQDFATMGFADARRAVQMRQVGRHPGSLQLRLLVLGVTTG